MKKAQQRGKDYEKAQARKHGGKPMGGPGQPDYVRGATKGEVKHWKKPVDSGAIKKAKQNGVTEISSISGFSKQAIEQAKQAGIKLIYRGKPLTQRL
jgi:hypothetical protein